METTTTILESVRKRIADTQLDVKVLTGFSVDEQKQMLFESAEAWLDYIGCIGEEQLMMTCTKQFWSFWRMEYLNLDRLFVQHVREWEIEEGEDCRLWYEYYHNPKHHSQLLDKAELNYHTVRKEILKSR